MVHAIALGQHPLLPKFVGQLAGFALVSEADPVCHARHRNHAKAVLLFPRDGHFRVRCGAQRVDCLVGRTSRTDVTSSCRPHFAAIADDRRGPQGAIAIINLFLFEGVPPAYYRLRQ
jgi:hypothetical protein